MHRIFTKASLAVASAAVLTAAVTPAAANGATHAGTDERAPVLYREAAGPGDCPAGFACLWQNIDFTGFMVGWQAGTYTADFRTIRCSGCTEGNFNDDASAWANFSGRTYCVSAGINGGNPDNTMPAGLYGPFTSDWNDRASSISFLGCP